MTTVDPSRVERVIEPIHKRFELTKPKVVCNIWQMSKGMKPKFLNSVTVKAGKMYFDYKGRRYAIEYESPAFKEGKKTYIYDVDINNSVGGLGFEKPDIEITAQSTERLLKDGTIEATFGRGGLPMWLFMVLAITAAGGMFLAVFFIPQYFNVNNQLISTQDKLDEYKTFYPPPPKPLPTPVEGK